jgi:hypothetical protein
MPGVDFPVWKSPPNSGIFSSKTTVSGVSHTSFPTALKNVFSIYYIVIYPRQIAYHFFGLLFA